MRKIKYVRQMTRGFGSSAPLPNLTWEGAGSKKKLTASRAKDAALPHGQAGAACLGLRRITSPSLGLKGSCCLCHLSLLALNGTAPHRDDTLYMRYNM